MPAAGGPPPSQRPALARIEKIRAEAGSIADLGAVRAAELLTDRLTFEARGATYVHGPDRHGPSRRW